MFWVRGYWSVNEKEFFVSKILLLENIVLSKIQWLCASLFLFEGVLSFRKGNGPKIEPELKAFSQYLKKLHRENVFPIADFNFDIHSFEFDISQGLSLILLSLRGLDLEVRGLYVLHFFHGML